VRGHRHQRLRRCRLTELTVGESDVRADDEEIQGKF
jgi:hypothetical protein